MPLPATRVESRSRHGRHAEARTRPLAAGKGRMLPSSASPLLGHRARSAARPPRPRRAQAVGSRRPRRSPRRAVRGRSAATHRVVRLRDRCRQGQPRTRLLDIRRRLHRWIDWALETAPLSIVQIDGTTHKTVKSIPIPFPTLGGVTFDHGTLWASDSTKPRVVGIDIATGVRPTITARRSRRMISLVPTP